jgi:hypothetical protein
LISIAKVSCFQLSAGQKALGCVIASKIDL